MADEHNKRVAGRIKKSVPKYKRPAPKLPTLPDGTPTAAANTPHLTSTAPADRHAAERKMLDDILGGGRSRAKHSKPKSKERRASHGAPGKDGSSDLITSMAARLGQLEKARYHHRDEMVRKDKEILKLKRRIAALESATEGKEETVSEIESLRAQNLHLKSQVHEMETFLNDYGLVWVGNSGGSGGGDRAAPEEAKAGGAGGAGGAGAGSGSKSHFSYDVDLLLERVKSLNASAGEGKMSVQQVGGMHKFVPPDSVKLTLYKDGIFLKRGPFRSFDTKEARAFVRDILDGYFPTEFKDHYPNGVVLQVTDKSQEEYDPSNFKAFGGKGRIIGDEGVGPKVHSLADVGGAQIRLGKKEFLAALPAAVLKGGKVIPVRKGIEDMLSGGGKEKESSSGAAASGAPSSGVVLVNTPVVQALNGDRPMTPADVATLRVKSDSGKKTLVIKLCYDDTIADLRRAVDEHRTASTPYELRTTFPRKAYTDLEQTLRDAGLIPNATLVVSPVEV